MKITIYDLLVLIKEGKEPKKIKFKNEIYEYKNQIKNNFIDYVGIEKETNESFYLSSYIGNNYISDIFTDEVEIIEEEPKKIEKCKNYENFLGIDVYMNYLKSKIDELIDVVNKLKEGK